MQVKAPDRPTDALRDPPVRAARHGAAPGRRHLVRSRKLQGLGYAAPTAVFVAVFFVLPLLLVGQMSLSDWPLLAGDRAPTPPRTTPTSPTTPSSGPRSASPCSTR